MSPPATKREPGPPGPPPLRPFGLVLHRDGSWTHDGRPITNPRLRQLFDRSVRYLPDEHKFVVQVGRFRGQIDVEEAAFFVRSTDLARGTLQLSDGSEEPLDPSTLSVSREGAGRDGKPRKARQRRSKDAGDEAPRTVRAPSGQHAGGEGALLCRVKHDVAPDGLLARFTHGAQGQLLEGVEDTPNGPALRLAGHLHPLPDL